MTSHHHFHHHHPTAPATATTPTPISTICHCYSCYTTPTYTPSPCHHSLLPTPPYTHYPPPPPQPHYYSSHPTPPPPPTPPPYYYQEANHQVTKDQQTENIVTSLLRRISALESSLPHRNSSSRQSLRDAAARTIQTHFRAFLARRSRTLRQLKQLTSIKTNLNILKSGKTHFDSQAVYHKAMDLLVKLDSIQGVDPLIRDGKTSIRNELTRFMKVISGVSVFSSRVVKNVRGGNSAKVFSSDHKMEFGTNRNEAIDKFVASVEESEEEEEEEEEEQQNPRFSETGKSGVLRSRGSGQNPKQKKSVSFAENVNVNGQESFDSEIELMKNLSRRVEKIGLLSNDAEVDGEEDGGGSSGSSDNETMDPNYISRKDDHYERRNVRDENDNETESFLFSAPLPVKMEVRAADNHINRKKGVKVVDN